MRLLEKDSISFLGQVIILGHVSSDPGAAPKRSSDGAALPGRPHSDYMEIDRGAEDSAVICKALPQDDATGSREAPPGPKSCP